LIDPATGPSYPVVAVALWRNARITSPYHLAPLRHKNGDDGWTGIGAVLFRVGESIGLIVAVRPHGWRGATWTSWTRAGDTWLR